jgi:hypothetical protein
LNFGSDANIQVEYIGPNVTLRIDPDRNGTWDYTYTAVVSNTGAGLCGAASYSQCYLDDWCYGINCCTTPPDPAGGITGPHLVCQGQTGVAFSVPAINNATSYVWVYSGTGATINGSGNNININFAVGATSGNLTVLGHNACGDGTVSALFPIVVDPCTGIEKISADRNATIVPNPSTGMFSVYFNAGICSDCKIRVLNAMGLLVYEADHCMSAGQNCIVMDLISQPPGVYYLILEDEDGKIIEPLMIAR